MWQALATTIVAGVLAVVFVVSTTVLIVTGNEVPSEFLPTGIALAFTAVGASTKATS